MKRYLLYGHGGAYNHGSEAAVRCTVALLRRLTPGCSITLSSHFPEQDAQFNMLGADALVGRNPEGKTNAEIYAETLRRITPDSVCLSMGGDNYCYPNWQRYAAIHYAAIEKGAKSVLWSCSVEPSMLKDQELLAALKTHHLITAREDASYRALRDAGLENVARVSDIAFLLAPEKTETPPEPYIALNLSPLILRKNPAAEGAFQRLLDEIIARTDRTVALVPHVEMPSDNDLDALEKLNISGPAGRLWRAPGGLSAAQYKYIISKAEALVATRTHATIAAWSSDVPALAVGYSAKARGVAADVGQAAYVLDAGTLDETGETLRAAFWELYAARERIRNELAARVGACMERARGAGAALAAE